MIRIGLPKGRLAGTSLEICRARNVELRSGLLRYVADVDGLPVRIYLMKAPDVARLIQGNHLDLGLTGDEWLLEHGIPGERWCVETGSYLASLCLLMARSDHRPVFEVRSVVTPFPNLARLLLEDLVPEVVAVRGSSEGMVPEVADACLDLVETGGTAACHQLAIRRAFRRVTMHVALSERSSASALAPVLRVIESVMEGAL